MSYEDQGVTGLRKRKGQREVFTLCSSLSPAILGNAYMSMFFAHDQDAELLKRSQSAYSQAVSVLGSCFIP